MLVLDAGTGRRHSGPPKYDREIQGAVGAADGTSGQDSSQSGQDQTQRQSPGGEGQSGGAWALTVIGSPPGY